MKVNLNRKRWKKPLVVLPTTALFSCKEDGGKNCSHVMLLLSNILEVEKVT